MGKFIFRICSTHIEVVSVEISDPPFQIFKLVAINNTQESILSPFDCWADMCVAFCSMNIGLWGVWFTCSAFWCLRVFCEIRRLYMTWVCPLSVLLKPRWDDTHGRGGVLYIYRYCTTVVLCLPSIDWWEQLTSIWHVSTGGGWLTNDLEGPNVSYLCVCRF